MSKCVRGYNAIRANQDTAFQVKELPDIPYDLGEIYSGLIPIDEKDPSRALFFVFQPTVSKPTDEVVIWLNGGPGRLIRTPESFPSLTLSRLQLPGRLPAREWQIHLGSGTGLGHCEPLLVGQPHQRALG